MYPLSDSLIYPFSDPLIYSKAAFRAAKLVRDTELQKRKDGQQDRPWWQPW